MYQLKAQALNDFRPTQVNIDDETVYVVVDPAARARRQQEAATRARLFGVNTREEYEAAGLVPRVSVPAELKWDYEAAAARHAAGCDPELVALAKANPADQSAGFRAYGMSY